jgi:hypothetical protein
VAAVNVLIWTVRESGAPFACVKRVCGERYSEQSEGSSPDDGGGKHQQRYKPFGSLLIIDSIYSLKLVIDVKTH